MLSSTISPDVQLDWRRNWLEALGLEVTSTQRVKETRPEPSVADLDREAPSLIERARQGDEAAARLLIQRLYPTVQRMVRSRLPRRMAEEDLTQIVFAKIFRNLHQFSGRVPLEHWVSRIAINTCLNQIHGESLRPELRMSDLTEQQEAVIQHLSCTESDLSSDQADAARELVEQLMARLKPDERLVVTLLHLEERSTEEISRITGWSVSRVKVKAFRARHKMRKCWKAVAKLRDY